MNFQKLLVVILFFKSVFNQAIYVDAESRCYSQCDGTILQPYNNLWAAMQAYNLNITEIVLINSDSPHFLLFQETNDAYNITFGLAVTIKSNLKIRPLYCDESIAKHSTQNYSNCIQRDEKLYIYMKSELFRINIQGEFSMENLVFDGSEDISKYNMPSPALRSCVFQRKLCCNQGLQLNSNNLSCFLSNLEFNQTNSGSLFFLTGSSRPHISLYNVIFQNINAIKSKSLLECDSECLFDIQNSTFNSVFFAYGIINKVKSYDYSPSTYVKLNGVELSNFNPYLTKSNFIASNGVILNIQTCNTCIVEIENSVFESIETMENYNLFTIRNSSFLVTNSFFQKIKLATIMTNLMYIHSSQDVRIESCSFEEITMLDGSGIIVTNSTQLNFIGIKFNKIINTFSGNFVLLSSVDAISLNQIEISESYFNGPSAMNNSLTFFNQTDFNNYLELRNIIITRNHFFGNIKFFAAGSVVKISNIDILENSVSIQEFESLTFFNLKSIESTDTVSNFMIKSNNVSSIGDFSILYSIQFQSCYFSNFIVENNTISNSFSIINVTNRCQCSIDRLKISANKFIDVPKTSGFINILGNVSFNEFIFTQNVMNSIMKVIHLKQGTKFQVQDLNFSSNLISNYFTNNFTNFFILPDFIEVSILNVTISSNDMAGGFQIFHLGNSAEGVLLNVSIYENKIKGANLSPLSILNVEGFSKLNFTNFEVKSNQLLGGSNIFWLEKNSNLYIENLSLTFNTLSCESADSLMLYFGPDTLIKLYEINVSSNSLKGAGCESGLFKIHQSVNLHSFEKILITKNYIDDNSFLINYIAMGFAEMNEITISYNTLTGLYETSRLFEGQRNLTLKVNDGKFSDNILEKNVKAFMMITNAEAEFTNCKFSRNTLNAGLKYIIMFNSLNSDIKFRNIQISENRLFNSSELFMLVASNVKFNGIVIQKNKLRGENLATTLIQFEQGEIGDFKLSILQNTLNSNNGQSYLIMINRLNITGVVSLQFIDNTLIGKGTVMIYFKRIIQDFYELKIQNNSILNSARFWVFDVSSESRIFDSIFEKNTIMASANFPSVLLYLEEDSLSIENCFFVSNMLSNYGLMIFGHVEVSYQLNNVTIEYNEIQDQANFLELKDSCYLNASLINISNNRLQAKAKLFFIHYKISGLFDRIVVKNNQIFDEALIMMVDSDSNVKFSNMKIDHTFKISDSTKFSSKAHSLILVTASYINFENWNVYNTSNLFFICYTTLHFSNLEINHLTPSQNFRQLLNGIQNTVTLENVRISSDENYISSYDSWIDLKFSELTIKNMSIEKIIANSGFFFNLVGTNVILNSVNVSGLEFLRDGNFISSSQSNFLDMSHVLVTNVKQLLSVQKVNFINIQNLVYHTTLFAPKVIIFDQVETLILNQIDIKLDDENNDRIRNSIISCSRLGSETFFENISIQNSKTMRGAIYLDLKDSTVNIILKNTTIRNSMGLLYSGSLSLIDNFSSKILLENCSFIENQALSLDQDGGRGAAIFYSTTSSKNYPNLTIRGSLFISNKAEKNGGAIYINGLPPILDDSNNFINNSVSSIVNHIASQAVKLLYMDLSSNNRRILGDISLIPNLTTSSSASIDSIGSGIKLDKNIELILVDMYNQIVIDDSNSSLVILTNSGMSASLGSIQAKNGKYNLMGLVLTQMPGINSTLSLKSTGIKSFENLIFENNNDASVFNLSLSFRNCSRGEVLLDTGACYECPEGFANFALTPNSNKSCTKCNTDSTKCSGGTNVSPNPGFWRFNDSSNIFLACPYSEACQGGNLSHTCTTGYTGNLCSKCEKGYGKVSKYSEKCENCENTHISYFYAALLIIANFGLIAYSTNSALRYSRRKPDEMNQDSVLNTVLIKNISNYFLTISLVGSIPIKWPNSFSSAASVSSQITLVKPDLLTNDCLYNSLDESKIQMAFMKLLAANLYPIIVVIIFTLFWMVYYLQQKKKIFWNKVFKSDLVTTYVIIFFNLQVPIIQSNLVLFSCKNLYRDDQPIEYLQSDFQILCWNKTHMNWIYFCVVPVLVIWAIILPLFILVILKRHSKNLANDIVVEKYSFIFRGYKSSKFYWEFTVFLRKYALIGVSVFGSFISIDFQIYVVIYIIWIAYILDLKFLPFARDDLNNLDQISLICAGIVNITGFYFQYGSSTVEVATIFTIILFAAFFAYVFFWLRVGKQALKYLIKSSNLLKKIPCVKRYLVERVVLSDNFCQSQTDILNNLDGSRSLFKSSSMTDAQTLPKQSIDIFIDKEDIQDEIKPKLDESSMIKDLIKFNDLSNIEGLFQEEQNKSIEKSFSEIQEKDSEFYDLYNNYDSENKSMQSSAQKFNSSRSEKKDMNDTSVIELRFDTI